MGGGDDGGGRTAECSGGGGEDEGGSIFRFKVLSLPLRFGNGGGFSLSQLSLFYAVAGIKNDSSSLYQISMPRCIAKYSSARNGNNLHFREFRPKLVVLTTSTQYLVQQHSNVGGTATQYEFFFCQQLPAEE